MAARKKPIEELESAKQSDPQVSILKVYEPAKRAAGIKIKAADAEEAVKQAFEAIDAAKVL